VFTIERPSCFCVQTRVGKYGRYHTVEDILERHVSIHSKSICNGSDAIRSECTCNKQRSEEKDKIAICQSTFGINICYLDKSQYNEQCHECVVSAPSLQHRRSPGVAGLLHSWYVRVESFLCGTLHRLLRASSNESDTEYDVLSFSNGLRHEAPCESEIRHRALSTSNLCSETYLPAWHRRLCFQC